MLRFTVLAIVLAVVSAESDDDLKKRCNGLGNFRLCCKGGVPKPKVDIDEFKDCLKPPPQEPFSCETNICVAKKRGYASSDSGDIDMEALQKIVAKDFEDYPDLITAIANNCINGDIDKFGPPWHREVCRLIKMERCIRKESVMACDWDDTGSCAGIKELIKECEPLMT